MRLLRRIFRALPESPRAWALWLRIRFNDAQSRRDARFARCDAAHALPGRHRWRQPIHETPTAENKRHNLRIAARALARTTIAPGATFSFARIIGPPTGMRGFRAGRSLVDGGIAASAGGGLCQLSSMLYRAALERGLQIVERHPHSLDIYTEDTRPAPLGADATVVYGYRDLRLRNPFAHPVAFLCRVDTAWVELELCCEHPLPEREVEFARHPEESGQVRVVTRLDGAEFCEQVYRRAAFEQIA